jgi:hypothetical protein
MRTWKTLWLFLCLMLPVLADDPSSSGSKTTTKSPNLISPVKPIKALEFKPLTAVQIRKPLAIKMMKIKPIIPSATLPKPQGPDPAATLDLSDMIDDPGLLEDLAMVCGWDSHLILQDTAAPHVFYYIPREFLLKRDPDGYRLNVQYNTRTEAEAPSVMLTAELESPHQPGDVNLLKAILRQALELKASDPLDIRALPGLGATADLAALATGLALAPERVHVTPPAHLKQILRMTLSLTQDETEEVLAQVARDGLVGTLNAKVKETVIPIPLRIQYQQFSGTQLKGFEEWSQGRTMASLENLTDFPVNLETINAYRLQNGQLERLSKKLKPLDMAPGKSKSLSLPPSKQLLGENLMVTWMGLSLKGDCESCIKKIDLKVRKGVGLAPGSKVHLEAIPSLFGEFGLYKLIVHVQSPYFTANGTGVQEQEVTLSFDQNLNESLQIFVPGDKGNEPLLYKYRLEAVMESGETRLEPQWTEARKLSQFFGASQVSGLFPDTPSPSSTPETSEPQESEDSSNTAEVPDDSTNTIETTDTTNAPEENPGE